MQRKTLKTNILAIIILIAGLSSCAEVTKSSSMAFDNANSVINSNSDKLWGSEKQNSQNAETPAAENGDKKDINKAKKY